MPDRPDRRRDGADDTQQRRERSLRYMFSKAPFITALGLELLEWDDDGVVVRMPYQPDLTNSQGTSHGGALAALMDSAGAAAV